MKCLTFMAGVCLSLICYNRAFSQGKIDSSQVQTLRIDPQSARGATVSQFFDEVKFIPLETTKESLFGNVAQLKVSGNRLIVYDYDTRAILMFSDNGKYLGKINASQLQNEPKDKEKAELYGFMTVKEDGKEYLAIYTQKDVQYFTLDGKFVKKPKTRSLNYSIELNDGKTGVKQYSYVKQGKDSTFYKLMLMDKVKKDSTAYFPYDSKMFEKDSFYGSGGLTKYAPSEAFYANFYDYNLYKVTKDKVSLSYKFVLPFIHTMPADFATNEKYFMDKRLEFFRDNPNVIYGIGPCYQLNDNLYIKLEAIMADKDLKQNLIYNLKSGELTSFHDLEPDSLSSFLPITDAGVGYDFKRGFLAFENGRFYTCYSSLSMMTFKERSADKHAKYPPLLENYFKTSDRKSNPIIVVLKPKTN